MTVTCQLFLDDSSHPCNGTCPRASLGPRLTARRPHRSRACHLVQARNPSVLPASFAASLAACRLYVTPPGGPPARNSASTTCRRLSAQTLPAAARPAAATDTAKTPACRDSPPPLHVRRRVLPATCGEASEVEVWRDGLAIEGSHTAEDHTLRRFVNNAEPCGSDTGRVRMVITRSRTWSHVVPVAARFRSGKLRA